MMNDSDSLGTPKTDTGFLVWLFCFFVCLIHNSTPFKNCKMVMAHVAQVGHTMYMYVSF